jgi:antitoxin component YwqK of YwqJK toxin-antitoxin module
MRNSLFFLLISFIPAGLFACGGCQTLSMRGAEITEMAAFDFILSGKVLKLETFKRPEYEAKAKEAMQHTFGYGSQKTEIPDFETKLTLKLTKSYKGKFAGEELTVWVKPSFTSEYCNYFHFKKDMEYVFFLDKNMMTDYHSLVYLKDFKKYSKEELGRTSKEYAEIIYNSAMKSLEMIANSKSADSQKFYNSDNVFYAEGALIEGKMEGNWTTYYATAIGSSLKKNESGTYKNGLKIGEWFAYNYTDGSVESRTSYENTEKDGWVKTYHKDNLYSNISFKDGKLHGKSIYYHWKSTEICYIYNYENGLLEGESTAFDIKGTLIEKTVYSKGFVKA